MSRYEEIKKKRYSNTEVKQPSSTSRYQQLKEDRPATNFGVDSAYIQDFMRDVETFFSTSQSDWHRQRKSKVQARYLV